MIITPEFRISFPYLFEPNTFSDNPKYELTMIFAANADLAALKAEIERVAREKWPQLPPNLHQPIRSGAEKAHLAGYGDEGTTFATARTNQRPKVIDAKGFLLGSDQVYAGQYAQASLGVFAYDHKGKKGVALGLNNVKVTRDGERLGHTASDPLADFGIEQPTQSESIF